MQSFNYSARANSGELIKSTVKANTKNEAISLLRHQGLIVTSVEEPSIGFNKDGFEQFKKRFRKVKTKDRVIFTRQLATMIKAGLPITQALALVVKEIDNPKLTDVVSDIGSRVEGGSSLAEAMREHSEIFNTTYVSMIEAGESSGQLDDTLIRLANQEEKNAAVVKKIRSAFTYPIVVFIVLIGVGALMTTLVLPQVGAMYTELNQPMPLTTSVLIGISDFAKQNFWVLPILGTLGVVGVLRYIKTPSGKKKVDSIKINIPVIGILIKKMYMAKFSRTMSSLVDSGVSILESLRIAKLSIGNYYYDEVIDEVRRRVKAGDPLSKPIERSELFLPLVGQMLSVGERTGGVGESLERVANYYEEEVDNTVETIQTLIEPFTIVVLGAMVLFLIVAVIFPIYSLVNQIN